MRKRLRAALPLVVIAAYAIWLKLSEPEISPPRTAPASGELAASTDSVNKPSEALTADIDESTRQALEDAMYLSDEYIKDFPRKDIWPVGNIRDYFVADGNYERIDDFGDYQIYDEAQLHQMSGAGDDKAFMRMAFLLSTGKLSTKYDNHVMEKLDNKIINGSHIAFSYMSGIHDQYASGRKSGNTEDTSFSKRKSHFLLSHAYMLLGSRAKTGRKMTPSAATYLETYKEFKLTRKYVVQLEELSEKMLAEINRERSRRGLGSFPQEPEEVRQWSRRTVGPWRVYIAEKRRHGNI